MNETTKTDETAIAGSDMLCCVNYFAPKSPEWLLKTYKGLRESDEKRDLDYSPLHDSIMNAICENLREYCPEAFTNAWSASLFPERLTKEILRLVEQQIQRNINAT